MFRRLVRVLAGAAAGAVLAWWGRHAAHAKQPAPEGRWREVSPDELGDRS